MNRIRAGYCRYVHPFSGAVHRISLKPSDCTGIVFWTRYATPLSRSLDELRALGYTYYFLFTLVGYPCWLETHQPTIHKAIDSFRQLARTSGPQAVHWRYDPIVLSGELDARWHTANFEYLSDRLQGHTTRCYISFVDFYGKTKRNLREVERDRAMRFIDPEGEEKKKLVSGLLEVASKRGIELHACCEDDLVGEGVLRAGCINMDTLRALNRDIRGDPKARPSRKGCGCVESVDIGAYDTCTMGCRYCYATSSRKAALERQAAHDPEDEFLWRPKRLQKPQDQKK